MKHLLYLAVLLWLAVPAMVQAEEKTQKKPNILHIHADDHRADGLHALGNDTVKTPNLDGIVERGTTFVNCYTQGSMVGAVCMPSRSMLLTGRSWLRFKQATEPAEFLPKVLSAAGYETWHMGKGGNEFTPGLKAFDTNLIDDGKGEERRGSSKRHADSVVQFLKQRKTDRPFYIYLAPPVPHDPRTAEEKYHKMYDPAKIPLLPAFLPQHPWDNGEMTVRDEKLAPWPRTPEDTKKQLADYYACVTGLDDHVGRIFAQLKESGDLNNTIIVYSADNGLSLGEHGLFGKQNLYEFGGMHVPLTLAGPGIPKGKSEALVYLLDLFPTFCEFAEAKAPESLEGKSLVPVIRGKQQKVRDTLYTGYRECQRSVRDDRWKLIRYPLIDKTQLFDLKNDPHELTNLAEKKEHSAKVAEMLDLLKKEMTRYGDAVPLTVPNPKPAEWSPPKKDKS